MQAGCDDVVKLLLEAKAEPNLLDKVIVLSLDTAYCAAVDVTSRTANTIFCRFKVVVTLTCLT